MVYAIKRCSSSDTDTPVPVVSELREKYTYNIYPCGLQPANEVGGAGKEPRPMAPLPSRGGSYVAESSCDESRRRSTKLPERRKNGHTKKQPREERGETTILKKTLCVGGGGDEEGEGPVAMTTAPLQKQIRYLGRQYSSVAQQPTQIQCDLHLTPPIARAYCPQQQKDKNPVPYYTAYAADVPLHVIRQSRALSGFDHMVKLYEHRKEQFMLSFAEPYQQPGGLGRVGRGSEREVELTQP